MSSTIRVLPITKDRKTAAQVSTLDTQLKQAQRQIEELRTQLCSANDVEFSLRKELEIWQLADHISQADLNVAELALKVQQLEEERGSLRREVDKKSLAVQRCSEDLARVTHENEYLRSELEKYQSKCNELMEENEFLGKERQAIADAHHAEQETLAELELLVDQQTSEAVELKSALAAQTAGTETISSKLDAAKREVDRLRSTLAEERNSAEGITKERDSLRQQLRELAEEHDHAMQQLTRYIGLAEPLETEILTLRERCSTLETAVNATTKLREDLSTLMHRNGELTNEVSELKRLVIESERREAQALRSLEDTTKKLVAERGKVTSLELEVREQRKTHDDSEMQLVSRIDEEKRKRVECEANLTKLTQNMSAADAELARLRILVAHRAKVAATARAAIQKDPNSDLSATPKPRDRQNLQDFNVSPETPSPAAHRTL